MVKSAVRAESGTTAWVRVFQERTSALPPTGICSYLSELGIQAYEALIRPDVPAL
jgi:hypothetical protein